jgi:inhibitor of KinA sporulation pathway (predicted exonuclease)
MKAMFLDLEMNQPSQSIIQVGAVIGDLHSGKVVWKYQKCISDCKKIKNETIDPFITTLTGISDMDIESGIPLIDAYRELVKNALSEQCHRNLWTWGGGDSHLLRTQLERPEDWPFGDRWIDIKTVYLLWALAHNRPFRSGLSKSLSRLGGQFKGTKHTAGDDAENTFYAAVLLLQKIKDGV